MNWLQLLLPLVVKLPEMMKSVEKLFGKGHGQEKKAEVVKLAKESIIAAELVTQKDIFDQAHYDAGIDHLVEGIFLLLKSTRRLKLD